MMSRVSPLGPWTAPDDDVLMKTNHATQIYGPGHGSVFRDSKTDKWYFAYLKYGRGGASRQVFVEQIDFHPDGTIQPLTLTGAGVGALRPPLVAEKGLEHRCPCESLFLQTNCQCPREVRFCVRTHRILFSGKCCRWFERKPVDGG